MPPELFKLTTPDGQEDQYYVAETGEHSPYPYSRWPRRSVLFHQGNTNIQLVGKHIGEGTVILEMQPITPTVLTNTEEACTIMEENQQKGLNIDEQADLYTRMTNIQGDWNLRGYMSRLDSGTGYKVTLDWERFENKDTEALTHSTTYTFSEREWSEHPEHIVECITTEVKNETSGVTTVRIREVVTNILDEFFTQGRGRNAFNGNRPSMKQAIGLNIDDRAAHTFNSQRSNTHREEVVDHIRNADWNLRGYIEQSDVTQSYNIKLRWSRFVGTFIGNEARQKGPETWGINYDFSHMEANERLGDVIDAVVVQVMEHTSLDYNMIKLTVMNIFHKYFNNTFITPSEAREFMNQLRADDSRREGKEMPCMWTFKSRECGYNGWGGTGGEEEVVIKRSGVVGMSFTMKQDLVDFPLTNIE
jgi:hypothetical protein